MSGGAGPRHRLVAAQQVLDRRRGDDRARPEAVGADPVLGLVGGEPQGQHRHPELRERVGRVALEPLRVGGERRRERQHVGVVGLAQVLERGLGEDEGAPRIDLLHQVEALHLELRHRREVDRRGVVDDDVDAAEALGGLRDRGGDLVGVANVADDRQRRATHLLDLLRGGVDGPRELRMGLGRLRDQRDVGAVGGDPLRDREADAAAPAGHDDGATLERCVRHDAAAYRQVAYPPAMALPPGPRAPAAVNTWRMLRRPLETLAECHARYGDAFTMKWLVFGTGVYVADPDEIKEGCSPAINTAAASPARQTPPLSPSPRRRTAVLVLDGAEGHRARVASERALAPPLPGLGGATRSAT